MKCQLNWRKKNADSPLQTLDILAANPPLFIEVHDPHYIFDGL